MKALILAAGYATRLYPLTKKCPKPLLKVGKRPLINYVFDKCERLRDVDEIIVVTNSKFISQFEKWRKNLKTKKRLSIVDDLTKEYSDRRGAIGDIDFVIDKIQIKDDLLVIGGDNLFTAGLENLISFAKTHNPYPVIGVYRLGDIRKTKHCGVVKLDAKNRILDFKEKPKLPASNLVAMCLYYFPKETLARVKEYLRLVAWVKGSQTLPYRQAGMVLRPENTPSGANKSDATGFYIDWLRKKMPVYGFMFSGHWYDIGNQRFYKEAKEEFGKET
jgi:glucose-1-phosphate thymidylyltransferase